MENRFRTVSPQPPWSLGVFRARPTRSGATADLTVAIDDVCVADCELGEVELAVSVTNQGAVAATPLLRSTPWTIRASGS